MAEFFEFVLYFAHTFFGWFFDLVFLDGISLGHLIVSAAVIGVVIKALRIKIHD